MDYAVSKWQGKCYKTKMIIFRFLIPFVFYANVGGWVRQNTTVVGS